MAEKKWEEVVAHMKELVSKEKMVMREMVDMEYIPALPEDINLREYEKIPMEKFGMFGLSVMSLFPTIVQSSQTMSIKHVEGLYRAVFPEGVSGHLAMAKDGTGALGTIVKDGLGIQGQARFKPVSVSPIDSKTTAMVFNPATMAIALALIQIEGQLQDIQNTQKQILEYMKKKDRAEIKGDFLTLVNVQNDFKLNWDNEKFLDNKSKLVQDIQKDAEQKIVFYSGQLQDLIEKEVGIINNPGDVYSLYDEVLSNMQDYKLSVYVYSFATYLQVLLEENYSREYLKKITNRIYSKATDYMELYTKCYNKLEDDLNKSLDNVVQKGVGDAVHAVGSVIGMVPFMGKGPVDTFLKDTGKELKENTVKSLKSKLESFHKYKNAQIKEFSDGIKKIESIYNRPMDLLTDGENVYYRIA